MAVETPARIAILGAGPIGLEAALYARYLGYDVDVYERGRVAEHLLQWGHVRLFTPFGANCSPLGLAALANQDDAWKPPDAGELLTGRELAERYYIPLSKSDLLVDHHSRADRSSGRRPRRIAQGRLAGEDRADADFRLLVRDAHSVEPAGRRIATADVVIDATGTFAQHNWLGEGGIPAIGEMLAERHIEYGMPDILGERPRRLCPSAYAGRRRRPCRGGERHRAGSLGPRCAVHASHLGRAPRGRCRRADSAHSRTIRGPRAINWPSRPIDCFVRNSAI